MDNKTDLNSSDVEYQCQNPVFDALLGTQTILLTFTNLFAVYINLSFLGVLHYCQTFHPNVHFLLQNISCGILCHSLHGISQCLYNVVLFSIGYDNVLRNSWSCVLFQIPQKVSTACVMFTFLAIGIERYNFTKTKLTDPKVVETSSNKVRLVAVLTWALGVPGFIEPIVNPRNGRVCYCILAYVTRDLDLYVTSAIFMFVQFITISLFPIVHEMNKRQLAKFGLASSSHSLTERTRAWRNIRTTSMLLPSAIVQGTMSTITFILIISTYLQVLKADKWSNLDFKIGCLWLQLFSVFNILHPILCVRHHHLLAVSAKEKSKFLYWLASRCSTITHDDVVGHTEAFSLNPDKQQNLLANFWEKSHK